MAAYSFIDNINDFFSTGYFTDDFQKKVFDKSGYSQDGIKELCSRFSALRQQYNRYKQAVTSRYAREKDKVRETFDFNTKLLACLDYQNTSTLEQPSVTLSLPIGENGAQQDVPVRIVSSRTDGSPQLYVMDIPTLISASEDTDAETGFAELGLDKLVTHIFSLPEQEHPRYILMSSGNMVFFMDAEKWERGAYLSFDIERLLVETTQSAMRNYFALFYLLVSHEALACIGDTPLMQQLEEESYKNAYAVTQDLKRGVVAAVEALANEAIWYIKHTPENEFYAQDETDDNFETMMRDDCLVFIYRLLFIFYAESRPDLDILPINDQTYQRGYSLEMLRDLEQVNLITNEERNGYFFDHSMKRLFSLILNGYNEDRVDNTSMTASFRVRHIDSPLFSDNKLKVLKGVKFRNVVWQTIICQLSLSQQQKGKMRGRISYANLGINQLGSVYENLLAYRGFYAEEDYIEVHPKGDTVETYLQPRSRRDVFEEEEILKDEDGHDIIHPKGQFIYRLNGRDRKKSASFYTPEVLTKSTVKYTLKPIVEKLERGEMKACDLLQMKLLEPAMGAAAFQNEVINQLAVLYLNFRKKEVGKSIDPLQYPTELQHVKAFIATNNVYGVDLNATAIELGKLSLWLNVMYKDMEVPFFSNRIGVGNAVIGAWLKVYKQSDVVISVEGGSRIINKKWWEAPTRRISFSDSRPERHYTEVYHFLLPVQEMLGIMNAKLPTFNKDEENKLKEDKKKMAATRKGWLKGITSEEYSQVQRISKKIDVLLKEYVKFQLSIAKYANNGVDVWQYEGRREFPFTTNAQREEFDDLRYKKNSPYMKLKMIMDYWCALFFWEYKDLADLPSRQEYWDDIERLLDVDVKEEAKNHFTNADPIGQETKQNFKNYDEAEDNSVVKAQALIEILAKKGGKQTNKLALDGAYSEHRFDIVESLANRYHFFHPMLEFLEVFWKRDGFDIICGNPPFLKWRFEAKSVISEKYPEVVVKSDIDAPILENIQNSFLQDDRMLDLYTSELIEVTCMNKLLNSPCLYRYLKGQQTDLFKCIITNCLQMQNKNGYMGLIHPNEIFDEATGQILRKYIYPRLEYRFQYQNTLHLFNGVETKKIFDTVVYSGSAKQNIKFDSINNLFTPQTIDECYMHTGHGICEGKEVLTTNGKRVPNTKGHKLRIIHYDEKMLKLVSHVFEEDADWQSCALVSLHSSEILSTFKKIDSQCHVSNLSPFVTVAFDATNSVKDGTIKKFTKYPCVDKFEMIFYSAQINILSPFYMIPRKDCLADYRRMDTVDYEKVNENFEIRTNYIPQKDVAISEDENIDEASWQNGYKLGFRKMLDQITSERTLRGAILPQKSMHTNSIISAFFKNEADLILFAGLSSSIVLDFYVRINAAKNLTPMRLLSYPYQVAPKLKNSLAIRVLMLNCVNKWYADLWNRNFILGFREENWSSNDKRLPSFKQLSDKYSSNNLLKSEYARRYALIEIDVISAMSFGLSFEDLLFINNQYFQISKKFDDTTWYDAKGRIVYSNKTYELDLETKVWESIKGEKIDENTFAGTTPTYVHTIDTQKSEIYGGEQITFYAPYTRCDRIADYRRAWEHFEKRFKNKD